MWAGYLFWFYFLQLSSMSKHVSREGKTQREMLIVWEERRTRSSAIFALLPVYIEQPRVLPSIRLFNYIFELCVFWAAKLNISVCMIRSKTFIEFSCSMNTWTFYANIFWLDIHIQIYLYTKIHFCNGPFFFSSQYSLQSMSLYCIHDMGYWPFPLKCIEWQ